MRNRYIVNITGEISKEKSQAFLQYIKDNNLYWWHWLSNTWLIVDTQSKIDLTSLRDKTKEIFKADNLIIRVDQGNWAGFGPNGENRNMFTWLKENWINE